MNRLLAKFAALSIIATATMLASAAQAATCSDVKLTLGNVSGEYVKMTKLQYKDGGSWKTKTGIFGIDGNDKIEDGWEFIYTVNFSGIDGESTDLKLQYYLWAGGSTWVGPYYEYHGTFTC